jgi:hypothetical protein
MRTIPHKTGIVLRKRSTFVKNVKLVKFAILVLAVSCSGCSVSSPDKPDFAFASPDKLYDGFKNPPASARPLARWSWNAGSPTQKEILNRLDTLKKEGFGVVEIYPAEDVNAKMLKFAADAAKKRGLLVDLGLHSTIAIPNLRPGERMQIITLGKKVFTGPATFQANVNDLISIPDETRPAAPGVNRRLAFLRLILQGLKSFQPGVELIDKVNTDGSVAFDIPDSNSYTLYIGVLNENLPRPGDGTAALNLLNKQAVEKYLNGITANLGPAFGGSLGDSIRAISCDSIDLSGANWTGDFVEQFSRRRGYDLIPYLPVVLDDSLPKELTRFYDTTRRVRYDYCLTFAELFNENFIQTLRGWCRDNGVLPRPSITDVNMFLALKDANGADFMSSDIPGNVPRNARLSYLCQSATPRSQIAVLLPTVDIWSDCGLYRSRCDDYIWYLFPLRQALNHNGFTADYITEQVLTQSTYDDGKLHFGSQTWDAVIVPDVCSIEFPAAKTLRFFAKAGGKIAFIGGYPEAAPGFNDLIQRTIPVQITMEHIQKEFKDRAVVFLPPQKDKDNLTSWAAELTDKLGLTPAVAISPTNDNVLFVNYTAGDRDIFFFTNTNRTQEASFNAKFNTTDKIPVVWDIETGARRIFPYGDKKNELDIRLKPLKSLLLVFDPNTKGKTLSVAK